MEKKKRKRANLPTIAGNSELDNISDEFPEVQKAVENVRKVELIVKSIMIEGIHFGVIPGCKKPSLLQPGSQILALAFGLNPKYEIEETDLGNGHKEYKTDCDLYSSSGAYLGGASAICSTKETKYLYRSESTGRDVPKDYWKNYDKELLGGSVFFPRKVWRKDDKAGKSYQKWVIYQQVEHSNPSDNYNTCIQISQKRAYTRAVKERTGASAYFDTMLDDDGTIQPGVNLTNKENDPPEKQSVPQPETNGNGLKKLVDSIKNKYSINPSAIYEYFNKNQMKMTDFVKFLKDLEKNGEKSKAFKEIESWALDCEIPLKE